MCLNPTSFRPYPIAPVLPILTNLGPKDTSEKRCASFYERLIQNLIKELKKTFLAIILLLSDHDKVILQIYSLYSYEPKVKNEIFMQQIMVREKSVKNTNS